MMSKSPPTTFTSSRNFATAAHSKTSSTNEKSSRKMKPLSSCANSLTATNTFMSTLSSIATSNLPISSSKTKHTNLPISGSPNFISKALSLTKYTSPLSAAPCTCAPKFSMGTLIPPKAMSGPWESSSTKCYSEKHLIKPAVSKNWFPKSIKSQ